MAFLAPAFKCLPDSLLEINLCIPRLYLRQFSPGVNWTDPFQHKPLYFDLKY